MKVPLGSVIDLVSVKPGLGLQNVTPSFLPPDLFGALLLSCGSSQFLIGLWSSYMAACMVFLLGVCNACIHSYIPILVLCVKEDSASCLYLWMRSKVSARWQLNSRKSSRNAQCMFMRSSFLNSRLTGKYILLGICGDLMLSEDQRYSNGHCMPSGLLITARRIYVH